jgi:hypothetical protein
MYPGSTTRFRDITDGTSNTVVIAETREPNAAVWIDGSTAALASRWVVSATNFSGPSVSINYKPYFPVGVANNPINQDYGPSSFHTGGCQHLLADGSVRFTSQNLDVKVYDAVVTRNGGEIVGEF